MILMARQNKLYFRASSFNICFLIFCLEMKDLSKGKCKIIFRKILTKVLKTESSR